jgi:hypothetical protein
MSHAHPLVRGNGDIVGHDGEIKVGLSIKALDSTLSIRALT